jgi:hypothetical protein
MLFKVLRWNDTISECISTELLKLPNFIWTGWPESCNFIARDRVAKVASLPGSRIANDLTLMITLISVTGTIA